MHIARPYCLTIAGMDPSAGAGVLADIKTFENHKVYGLAVTTAITFQNDEEFLGVRWYNLEEIEQQLKCLKKFPVKAIKIGLIENIDQVKQVSAIAKSFFPGAPIVWDPILKASAGFTFHKQLSIGKETLENIDLITPNLLEHEALKRYLDLDSCSVLLKGGHSKTEKGTDYLTSADMEYKIPGDGFTDKYEKHGSGCVLSAAITANLAMGIPVHEACKEGKKYVEKFLKSSTTKLGYHS